MNTITPKICVASEDGDLEFSVQFATERICFTRKNDGTDGLFYFELSTQEWDAVCKFINRELKEPF